MAGDKRDIASDCGHPAPVVKDITQNRQEEPAMPATAKTIAYPFYALLVALAPPLLQRQVQRV